jgi:hypothetical protein
MRTIPRRTDPLTRATMPAITSTAAMIHKMVSVLPPPFAASIPRTPSMSPPFILGNYRRGRRSVADRARPTARRLAPGRWPGCSPLGFVAYCRAGCTTRSEISRRFWTTSGSSPPHLRIWSSGAHRGFAGSDLDGVGLLHRSALPPVSSLRRPQRTGSGRRVPLRELFVHVLSSPVNGPPALFVGMLPAGGIELATSSDRYSSRWQGSDQARPTP